MTPNYRCLLHLQYTGERQMESTQGNPGGAATAQSEEKSTEKPTEFTDEKNLIVSFIQFLRHYMAEGKQCTPDESEGIEGSVIFHFIFCLQLFC